MIGKTMERDMAATKKDRLSARAAEGELQEWGDDAPSAHSLSKSVTRGIGSESIIGSD